VCYNDFTAAANVISGAIQEGCMMFRVAASLSMHHRESTNRVYQRPLNAYAKGPNGAV